jgi:hypothetical protein
MEKIHMLFAFVKLVFTNTSEVMKGLYNLTVEMKSKNLVVSKYGLKQGLPTVDLLDLLPGLNETIDNYSFLEGTSRVTDIVLLKQLAKKFSSCRYLELGTWRGESLYNVAQVSGECYSVSFSEEEMRRAGMGESSIKVSRLFSKGLKNVTDIKANSQTYDFSKLEKSFDLVFVDADHKYEGVKIDTQTAFKLLKDENSIIVWHDFGRGLEGINNWQVLAGALDGAPSEEHRKKIYRVSNTLCGIFFNGKVDAKYPEAFVPNKTFSLSLKAEKI